MLFWLNVQVIQATQTGEAPLWQDLCLPDAIQAQDHAFPHAYNQVKMPKWLKAWILCCQDNNACLLMGESSFQASCVMTGETLKLLRVLEKRVQYLEKGTGWPQNGLERWVTQKLFLLTSDITFLDHKSCIRELENDLVSCMRYKFWICQCLSALEGHGEGHSVHGSDSDNPFHGVEHCCIEGERGTPYPCLSY